MDLSSGRFGDNLLRLHVELLVLPCLGDRSLDRFPGESRSKLDELPPLELVCE